GSGKSNIVEAFCFVLGWMSAKTMRAERFSDLLFNGGNGQRPAPFAEVSLHFDNSDGALPVDSKVVVISRRVDRSGKCVYMINKRRVSRQEIVDLLAKTMSSPGGYNFIMQGDVDRFIKMSPLERRAIIDDIAGIAEYDEKKEKSLAELQKVEANLQSMGAILNEIGMQMERLRKEKEDAIRYRQLRDQLEHSRAVLLLARANACRRKLSEVQARMASSSEELSKLRERSRKISEELKRSEDRIRQLDKLMDERRRSDALVVASGLRERMRTLAEMVASTTEERTAVEAEISRLRAKVERAGADRPRQVRGALERLRDEIEGISSRFAKLKVEFDGLRQVLSEPDRATTSDLRRAAREMASVLEGMNRVLQEFDSCVKRAMELWGSAPPSQRSAPRPAPELQRLQSELASLEGQRFQLDKRLEELRRRLREAEVSLEEIAGREREVRRSIQAIDAEKNSLQRRAASLRERLARVQGEIQAVEGKLQEYHVEGARLQAQLEMLEGELGKMKVKPRELPSVEVSKLEKEIERIEVEIEAMGPINERAIRDFRNIERRYSSQKARYDKLVWERQKILNFMEEVDRKKTEVFMRTFEEISKNFGRIFGELSPGGTARLVLENPERPLEGGLEIEAKPAGKELVRVEAMSGGERALTALAFIFAVQRAKPTALYVLDEIDAHLDDENLKRVAELLRRSSRETQIVVVTLRDAMMSVADRLFGVSMDGNGISRVVSVELAGLAA
ncbi:MAG: chromosome segregation protein SMC, partial [Hadesarchaea archaeon]|nr:chromosome segregation protein SMC [Hadesarchaea archaeon]